MKYDPERKYQPRGTSASEFILAGIILAILGVGFLIYSVIQWLN